MRIAGICHGDQSDGDRLKFLDMVCKDSKEEENAFHGGCEHLLKKLQKKHAARVDFVDIGPSPAILFTTPCLNRSRARAFGIEPVQSPPGSVPGRWNGRWNSVSARGIPTKLTNKRMLLKQGGLGTGKIAVSLIGNAGTLSKTGGLYLGL